MALQYHTNKAMKNGYRIIRKEQHKTTKWSGGTMTELYFYPETAYFGKRNFLFHVASATVDLEKSIFSDFTNYNRIIMTLDNKLELIHNNEEKVTLNKYEPHIFNGNADTVSYGKVTDFNLIMRKDKCMGDAYAFSITKSSIIYPRKTIHNHDHNLEIVYCVSGSLTFNLNSEKLSVNQSDILLIDHKILGKDYYYSNNDNEICDAIVCTVMCNDC